jgi:bifunctional DNA-binding transcriptional regulator/antitoxin component of YhaV-PrlF toxin-antitoxin module
VGILDLYMIAKCDNKGRLYIPKELQSKIAKEMYIVVFKDGLILVPVPIDPINVLQAEGRALGSVSVEELKASAHEEAAQEIATKLKRMKK